MIESNSEVCCCFREDDQRWPLGLGDVLGETIMKKGRKPHLSLSMGLGPRTRSAKPMRQENTRPLGDSHECHGECYRSWSRVNELGSN